MTPERWEQIEGLYHATLEVPSKERALFLEKVCAGDAALHQEVESLLAMHEQTGGFLGKPAVEAVVQEIKQDATTLIGKQLGSYQVVELLGAGGMGEVYRAQDRKLARQVAIKVLPEEFSSDPERVRRFRHEARVLAALNHPNIAAIYGLEEWEGRQLLVMELVEGQSLAQQMFAGAAPCVRPNEGAQRGAPLPVDMVLEIGIQVAEVLEEAHSQGIIHRDIKPANLMLTANGRVKVLDFGLAKAWHGDHGGVDLSSELKMTATWTEEGMLIGTPAYMSPEQVRGEKADKEADIWAFGCLLYEMLSGKKAFAGKTTTETAAVILRDEPKWQALPKETPAAVFELIQRCLKKDAHERLASMNAARETLEEIQSQIRSGQRWKRAVLRRKTGKMILLISMTAILLVAAGGTYWLTLPQKPLFESLAVLPIRIASSNPTLNEDATNLAYDLTSDLARLSGLRKIIANRSMVKFKDSSKSIPEIATEVKVDGVVDATLRQKGDQMLLTAQLIEGKTGNLIWTKQYERESQDLSLMPRELARDVAKELKIQLKLREESFLGKSRRVKPEAYRIYAEVRDSMWTRMSFDEGERQLKRAIEIDPTFVEAYAMLARCCQFMWVADHNVPPQENSEKFKKAARQVMELDPDLGVAYSLAGEIDCFNWKWFEADSKFKKARELDPNNPDIHYAYSAYLIFVRKSEEGIAAIKRAIELDPLTVYINSMLPWCFQYSRRYDEAIESAKEYKKQFGDYSGHWLLAQSYAMKGMCKEALAEATLANDGWTFAKCGEPKKAREILSNLLAKRKKGYVDASDLAVIYLALGNKEKAFEWLEKAVQEHAEEMNWLKCAFHWDPIRSDPRFLDLLRRVGFPP